MPGSVVCVAENHDIRRYYFVILDEKIEHRNNFVAVILRIFCARNSLRRPGTIFNRPILQVIPANVVNQKDMRTKPSRHTTLPKRPKQVLGVKLNQDLTSN